MSMSVGNLFAFTKPWCEQWQVLLSQPCHFEFIHLNLAALPKQIDNLLSMEFLAHGDKRRTENFMYYMPARTFCQIFSYTVKWGSDSSWHFLFCLSGTACLLKSPSCMLKSQFNSHCWIYINGGGFERHHAYPAGEKKGRAAHSGLFIKHIVSCAPRGISAVTLVTVESWVFSDVAVIYKACCLSLPLFLSLSLKPYHLTFTLLLSFLLAPYPFYFCPYIVSQT